MKLVYGMMDIMKIFFKGVFPIPFIDFYSLYDHINMLETKINALQNTTKI